MLNLDDKLITENNKPKEGWGLYYAKNVNKNKFDGSDISLPSFEDIKKYINSFAIKK